MVMDKSQQSTVMDIQSITINMIKASNWTLSSKSQHKLTWTISSQRNKCLMKNLDNGFLPDGLLIEMICYLMINQISMLHITGSKTILCKYLFPNFIDFRTNFCSILSEYSLIMREHLLRITMTIMLVQRFMRIVYSCTNQIRLMVWSNQDQLITSFWLHLEDGQQASLNFWFYLFSMDWHTFQENTLSWHISLSMLNYFLTLNKLSSIKFLYMEKSEEYMLILKILRKLIPHNSQVRRLLFNLVLGKMLFDNNFFDSNLIFRD